MSEAAPPDAAPSQEGLQMPIRVHGQYIKDMSFEVPNAPDVFLEIRQTQPEIQISLDTAVRSLPGGSFEVTLSVDIDATVAGKKAFILELVYCAFVAFGDGMPDQHKHPLLMIEVPRQMFPFVRQIVATTTTQGGFPPMMMEMIDFAGLYRARFGDTPQPPPEAQASVH